MSECCVRSSRRPVSQRSGSAYLWPNALESGCRVSVSPVRSSRCRVRVLLYSPAAPFLYFNLISFS